MSSRLDNYEHGSVHKCFLEMLDILEEYLQPVPPGRAMRMHAYITLSKLQQAFAKLPLPVAIQYLTDRPGLKKEYKYWIVRDDSCPPDDTIHPDGIY